MTVDEACQVATEFQFERDINNWVNAVIRMSDLKKPTPVQAEANAVLADWLEAVRNGTYTE